MSVHSTQTLMSSTSEKSTTTHSLSPTTHSLSTTVLNLTITSDGQLWTGGYIPPYKRELFGVSECDESINGYRKTNVTEPLSQIVVSAWEYPRNVFGLLTLDGRVAIYKPSLPSFFPSQYEWIDLPKIKKIVSPISNVAALDYDGNVHLINIRSMTVEVVKTGVTDIANSEFELVYQLGDHRIDIAELTTTYDESITKFYPEMIVVGGNTLITFKNKKGYGRDYEVVKTLLRDGVIDVMKINRYIMVQYEDYTVELYTRDEDGNWKLKLQYGGVIEIKRFLHNDASFKPSIEDKNGDLYAVTVSERDIEAVITFTPLLTPGKLME